MGARMCTFYLQDSLSASGFQGAGRPRFSQSCARPISGSFLLPQGSRYCKNSHRCHQVNMTCGARSLLTLGEISKQETCGCKTRILTIVGPGQ
jgi:hypothetical protein